jgi:ribosomal protein S20
MARISIADKAAAAAAAADEAQADANGYAREAQHKLDAAAAGGYGHRHPAWEWVDYAEQSARRAKEYAREAAAAAQSHDIPEANRRLRNAQSEAYGARSNADSALRLARKD